MIAKLFRRGYWVRVGPRTGPNGIALETPEVRYIAKGRGNWACWQHDKVSVLLSTAECWAKHLPFRRGYWDRVGPRTGPNGIVLETPEVRYIANKGRGNWACWQHDEVPVLLSAAERWAKQLPAGNRFWLCWDIQDDWCRLQQRLILEAGWTPVVGCDPSLVSSPTVLPGAVRIDFYNGLGVPDLWLQMPLELVFGWAERLAFWHADVLLPRPLLRKYARQFEQMAGPITAALYTPRVKWQPKRWDNAPRYWEVLGCTTRAASAAQWAIGGGWWRHFQNHPNCPPVPDLIEYHWDMGGGIYYWQRAHSGRVVDTRLPTRFHFSPYHRPDLRRGRPLDTESLKRAAEELDLTDLLDV